MDSTLYEDHSIGCVTDSPQLVKSANQLKSQLTLDLKNACQRRPASSLSCMAIDSPDFEKFIASQSDLVSTTPTTQILFPKLVTEEQEAYARGFIDALEELHKRQGVPVAESLDSEVSNLTAADDLTPDLSDAPLRPFEVDRLTVSTVNNDVQLPKTVEVAPSSGGQASAVTGGYFIATSLAATAVGNFSSVGTSNAGIVVSVTATENNPSVLTNRCLITVPADIVALKSYLSNSHRLPMGGDPVHVSTTGARQFSLVSISSDNPQTVPCIDSGASPSSPDEVVLERKRARNRVAAQKCRMRKIERIEELSDRVRDLHGENDRLSQISGELRNQIADLKREILSHVNSGCRVMASSSSQS